MSVTLVGTSGTTGVSGVGSGSGSLAGRIKATIISPASVKQIRKQKVIAILSEQKLLLKYFTYFAVLVIVESSWSSCPSILNICSFCFSRSVAQLFARS